MISVMPWVDVAGGNFLSSTGSWAPREAVLTQPSVAAVGETA